MINRQLSRLLLCSILGSTTLISGCALVRKDSAPHQQLKPEQIKLADDIHLASSGWPQAQWWSRMWNPIVPWLACPARWCALTASG